MKSWPLAGAEPPPTCRKVRIHEHSRRRSVPPLMLQSLTPPAAPPAATNGAIPVTPPAGGPPPPPLMLQSLTTPAAPQTPRSLSLSQTLENKLPVKRPVVAMPVQRTRDRPFSFSLPPTLAALRLHSTPTTSLRLNHLLFGKAGRAHNHTTPLHKPSCGGMFFARLLDLAISNGPCIRYLQALHLTFLDPRSPI